MVHMTMVMMIRQLLVDIVTVNENDLKDGYDWIQSKHIPKNRQCKVTRQINAAFRGLTPAIQKSAHRKKDSLVPHAMSQIVLPSHAEQKPQNLIAGESDLSL